jgi:hypothetical protein
MREAGDGFEVGAGARGGELAGGGLEPDGLGRLRPSEAEDDDGRDRCGGRERASPSLPKRASFCRPRLHANYFAILRILPAVVQ